MSLSTQEKRKFGFAVPISIKSALSLLVVLIGGQGYVCLSMSSVHISVFCRIYMADFGHRSCLGLFLEIVCYGNSR